MTPEQIELARHALGLDGRRKQSFRNHFVTGPYSSDYQLWVDAANAGDAKMRESGLLPKGDACFWLTEQGAKKALAEGESLCPEDFPQANG